jgi:hypothetical protein
MTMATANVGPPYAPHHPLPPHYGEALTLIGRHIHYCACAVGPVSSSCQSTQARKWGSLDLTRCGLTSTQPECDQRSRSDQLLVVQVYQAWAVLEMRTGNLDKAKDLVRDVSTSLMHGAQR